MEKINKKILILIAFLLIGLTFGCIGSEENEKSPAATEPQPQKDVKEDAEEQVQPGVEEEQVNEEPASEEQLPDIDEIVQFSKKAEYISMADENSGFVSFIFEFEIKNTWDKEIDYINVILDPQPESKVQKSRSGDFMFQDIPPGIKKEFKLELAKHGGFEYGFEFPLNVNIIVNAGNQTVRKTFDLNVAIPEST